MAKGPRGEKRPADAVARAVLIAKIATHEASEVLRPVATTEGKRVGGIARAKTLTEKERSEIARNAAQARWDKEK